MSNFAYQRARAEVIRGNIDLLADTLKVCLLNSATNLPVDNGVIHYFSEFSADVVGTPQTLQNKTISDAAQLRADPVTFTGLPSVGVMAAVVIYKDTGVAGTSQVIASYDTSSTYSLFTFPRTLVGQDIKINWIGNATQNAVLRF